MGLLSNLFGKKENIRKREGNHDVHDLPNENKWKVLSLEE